MTQVKHHMASDRKVLTLTGLFLQAYYIFFVIPSMTSLFDGILELFNELDTPLQQDIQDVFINVNNYFHDMMKIMDIFYVGLIIFFVFNLLLFGALIKNTFTSKRAKSIYLYQGIIGILMFAFQPLAGAFYVFSGFGGFQDVEIEESSVREGI